MVLKLAVLISFLQCACSSLAYSHQNATTSKLKQKNVEKDFIRWVNHVVPKSHKRTWETHKLKTKTIKRNKKESSSGHTPSGQKTISSLPIGVNHVSSKAYKRKWKTQKQKTKDKVKHCKTIKVSKKAKSCSGHFTTVQEAITSLPIDNSCRVVISIGAGIYREKEEVPATMAYATLKGAGTDKTHN